MRSSPASHTELQVSTAPTEVPTHTFSANNIDTHLFRQFVLTSQSQWETSMPAGHIIWKTTVHPSTCNPFVAYISKMYNSWGGSLEYQFIIAGTGFNGGKLLLVKTPPNIDPSALSLTDLTILPNTIIDVKSQDSFGITASDQRPMAYHYMNQSQGHDMDNYAELTSTGGHVALVVLNPLVGANVGATSVSFSAFTRPGADFTLSQMISPQINHSIVVDFEDMFAHLMDLPAQFHFDVWPRVLRATTESTINNMTTSHVVTRKNKSWISKGHEGSRFDLKQYEKAALILHNYELKQYKVNVGFSGVNVTYKFTDARLNNGSTDIKINRMQVTPTETYFEMELQSNEPGSIRNLWIYFGLNQDTNACIYGEPIVTVETISILAPKGETFIRHTFAASPAGTGHLQSNEVFNKISSDVFSTVPDDMDLVYVLRNMKTRQPLTYVRFTSQGLFTVNKPKIQTDYSSDSVVLTYSHMLDHNARLTANTNEMEMANDLYQLERRLSTYIERLALE